MKPLMNAGIASRQIACGLLLGPRLGRYVLKDGSGVRHVVVGDGKCTWNLVVSLQSETRKSRLAHRAGMIV